MPGIKEKLEQLKKVVQEANPEIMELKFGCKYTLKKQGGEYVVDGSNYIVNKTTETVKIISICNHPSHTRCCGEYQNIDDEPIIYKIDKILGRPIRLADVLLVLDSIDRIAVADSLLSDNKTKYNLKNDNLDHQSEETINFLHSILCQESKQLK